MQVFRALRGGCIKLVPETVCISSHRTKGSMTQMFCDASKTSFGFSTVFGVLVA